MAKLETQINQIFINPTETKKTSLILFEEKMNANTQLFLIAELKNIQKKTELNDLSKISELIIESFKNANKKLPADAMFEAVLATINNELAEFAHKGRKSWLGKFSALIALKVDKDLFLANSGHTCAWLKRKNSLNELLSSDKTETHPLKTFLNFSSGRLTDGDTLVLTTSSIFNYVSVELFSKTLNSYKAEESCGRISEILKSSAKSDEGFAVFILGLNKSVTPEVKEEIKPEIVSPTIVPASKELKKEVKAKTPVVATTPIYAPMPEDMETEPLKTTSLLPTSLPKLSLPSFSNFSKPELKLPKLNIKFPEIGFLPNISGPAKFFLASFILFAVLFAMNIAAFGVRKSRSEQLEKFNASAEVFVGLLTEAESALLYRNQSQAMKLMSSAETELHKLQQIDDQKSEPFMNKFDEMNNKINRVTVLRNLTPAFDMPYPVNFLARAGGGYLVANENPNSLGTFTDNSLKNLFMLNKTDGDVRGIAHVSGQGNFVASRDKIYFANEGQQEFTQLHYISNADLSGLKFVDPNRIYTINKTTNQVVRMNASSNGISAVANILRTNNNLQDAQDFAVDTDIYILFPDKVTKFVNGNPSDFVLAPVSEPAKEMKRIRVGNQIYLLEPIAKRVLIYNKRGELLNQVQFPSLTELSEMYVDESKRELLLVNGNKVYRITF